MTDIRILVVDQDYPKDGDGFDGVVFQMAGDLGDKQHFAKLIGQAMVLALLNHTSATCEDDYKCEFLVTVSIP